MAQNDIQLAAIIATFEAKVAAEAGKVIRLAEIALNSIQEHHTGPITEEWIAGFVSGLQNHKALLIRGDDIPEAHEHTVGFSDTLLLFQDNTVIAFDDDDEARQDILDLRGSEIEIDTPFTANAEVEVVAASAAFLARHPDLDAWKAALPEEIDGDDIDAIGQAIIEEDDPHIDGIDMTGSENWTHDEVEELDALLTEIWLAFGSELKLSATIYSAFEEDGGSIYANIMSSISDEIINPIEKNYEKIVHLLVDLDGFEGHEWTYNDGAHDRVSGYGESSRAVTSIEIDPADFSQHERLAARKSILTKLVGAGLSEDEAEALITIPVLECAQ